MFFHLSPFWIKRDQRKCARVESNEFKRLTLSAEGQGCLLTLIWQMGSVTPSSCSLRAVRYSIILINVPLIPQNRLMNQTLYCAIWAALLTVSVTAVCEVAMIY